MVIWKMDIEDSPTDGHILEKEFSILVLLNGELEKAVT